MSKILELTENNFEQETSNGLVLVDFWAPWCGPCKMLGPVLEQVSDEVGDKAKVAKVNVDECPNLANKFEVRSIPAIYLLKDGKTINQFIGLQDKQNLVKAINEAE